MKGLRTTKIVKKNFILKGFGVRLNQEKNSRDNQSQIKIQKTKQLLKEMQNLFKKKAFCDKSHPQVIYK